MGGAVLAASLAGCGQGQQANVPPLPTPTPASGPPNFVVIVADDLGYGDLGLVRVAGDPHAQPRPDGRRRESASRSSR